MSTSAEDRPHEYTENSEARKAAHALVAQALAICQEAKLELAAMLLTDAADVLDDDGEIDWKQ